MAYSEIYRLFKSKKSLSVKLLENTPNIFELVTMEEHSGKSNKSILEIFYKLEIEDYIEKNIISKGIKIKDLKEIKSLDKFSDLYEHELCTNKKIEEFIKNLIYYKNILEKLDKNIDIFLLKNNSIHVFSNPINSENLFLNIINKNFFEEKINKDAYNENLNKIKITFDLLFYSDVINNKIPSIGLNDIYLLDNYYIDKTYKKLCNILVNNKNAYLNITNYLPLTGLFIDETISDILLKNSDNLLNNNNFLNFNENHIKNLIINMIKKININLEDIYLTSNNGKITKIKMEYLIPFKKKDEKIEYITNKSELDKFRTFDSLIKHNNDIMSFIINNTFQNIGPSISNEKIDEKHYKDVLACYLFYIIRLIYDISKKYIDEIDNILIQFINTKDKRFTVLNIKEAFEYTSSLNNSLLNFKIILLNNFYELFLPSKIGNNMYGMKIDSNGCYIPEDNNTYLIDNKYFFENYPFNDYDFNVIDNPYILNEQGIKNIISKIKNKNDIYDKKKILEFGGFVFNSKIINYCSNILKEYYNFLKIANNFNIFIINKVIDTFKDKKNIPYELIKDIVTDNHMLKKMDLSDAEIDQLNKKYINIFKTNIEKSTNYYKKLYDIKKKIKNSKANTNNLHIKENILYLSFNIYYIKAMCILTIIQNIIVNTKLKNNLLKKLFEQKKLCEDEIKYYISNK